VGEFLEAPRLPRFELRAKKIEKSLEIPVQTDPRACGLEIIDLHFEEQAMIRPRELDLVLEEFDHVRSTAGLRGQRDNVDAGEHFAELFLDLLLGVECLGLRT
jgi:hypothetical protein